MSEYRYSTKDRQAQLERLAAALRSLIAVLPSIQEFSSRVGDYESALQRCEALLLKDFTQEQVSELSRSVPDLYFRHKEWVPPLERTPAGEWREPDWFVGLEERLQAVLKAAELLRIVGYY